jgi:hypothetical protein
MAGNPGGTAPTGGPYAPAPQQCSKDESAKDQCSKDESAKDESAKDRVRVSDAERDEAISQLGERFAEGRLTHDTFMFRVDAALRARDRRDLAQLLADLPSPRTLGSALRAYGRRGWAAVTGGMSAARSAAPPVLMFPSSQRERFTIGRDGQCDLVLPHPSVSRWHAGLKRCASGWMLDDLGSTNGTRLNGWRVTEPVQVRPGDQVSFGAMTFVVAAPGPAAD